METPLDPDTNIRVRLPRLILSAFVLTFIAARLLVFAIMARWIPDLYLHVGANQTHVHHLNYGIFLLSFVGAYLLLGHPRGKNLERAGIIYGIGLALTFDEFGMWLHLWAGRTGSAGVSTPSW